MLTVEEALTIIQREVRPFDPQMVPLQESLGLILAEDVISEIDSPPFDKALMDGYAVRSADITGEGVTLNVIEELTAGKVALKPVGPGEATRIMTGAPLPDGADAVVRVEETEFDADSGRVRILSTHVEAGANRILKGTSLKTGETVLPASRLLRPQELGALAEIGEHKVSARRKPAIAVLATGDELVPVEATPGPGQIRNSNETMLAAQIQRAGGLAVPLGIAKDDVSHLKENVFAGLQSEILLLSGGVSAGKLDLVPSVLKQAGVKEVFHKVQVKPGKPIWFGLLEGAAGSRRYVFGLPGNPVSSLVCFELFVRTAIRRLMGSEPAEPQAVRAVLTQEHIVRGDRPTYHPAQVDWKVPGPAVTPIHWHGSSDLRSTVNANSMALFPPGEKTYAAGDSVYVYLWE